MRRIESIDFAVAAAVDELLVAVHNSFLHIFYITFKVRKLQLQMLLTEKYLGLKPETII